MPGYDLKINGEYARIESLECSSCKLILRDAIQNEEGERFCKSCWEEAISSSSKAEKLGINPYESPNPDIAARREIYLLPVFCENYENGCEWTGNLRDHEHDHKAICEYKILRCFLGCGKRIPLGKSRKHEQEECQFRKVRCPHCRREMLAVDYNDHLLSCPFQNALEYDTILKKWFNDKEEGWIDLIVTRMHMVGPAGSGKTCAQNLLLNEPPPQHLESIPHSSSKSITDSTPIACKAVKAIKIASGDNETWMRITRAELLERLSSSFKKAAAKFSQQKQVTSPPPSSTESVSRTSVSNEEVSNEEVTPEAPEPLDHGVVIKKIVEYVFVAKAQLNEKWAYIIDSGGQPAFQELLPVFIRAASLNIITLDLSKGLDEEFEYTYRISGKEFKCDEKMKYSNRRAFNSIVSAASVQKALNIPFVTKPAIQSMSFVLGTHYDVIRNSGDDENEAKEKIKKMSDELMSQLDSHSKGCIIQKIHEDSIIFPVDTLVNNVDERTKISQKLFKKISGCNETSLTVRLPIRLFVFELCLDEKAKDNGGFVTKEEAIEEGARLGMNGNLVEAALTYLHNCTIILYYPNVKPQLVFVHPQRILDVLSQLLALTYFDKDTAQSFVPEIIQEEMTTLKDRGCFTEDLLKKFTTNAVFTGKFQPKYFINLLENCHIIAKLQKDTSQAEDVEYFLPSALPSYNDTFEKSPTDRKPLLYVWRKQKERITARNFVNVPRGIFPLMIVRLLNQEDYVVQLSNPASHKVTQFRDAVSLLVSCDKNDTDPHERLYIINRRKHIEVIFTGKKEHCPKINALVCKVINESANDINISVEDLKVAFACQREVTKYCVVKDEADQGIACYECFHTCTLDDSYWCWFNTSGSAQQHISDTEGSGSSQCKRRPVDEKIDGKSKELNMAAVTWIFRDSAHHYMLIGAGLGVNTAGLILIHVPGQAQNNLLLVFQSWFDSNENVTWDALKQLCGSYSQLGRAGAELKKYLSQ